MPPIISFDYQASEAHLLAAAREQFYLRLGWRWVAFAALFAVGAVLYFLVDDHRFQWVGVFSLLCGWVGLVGWAKTYRRFMALARQTRQRLDDPTVHVELNDRAIESRSSIGTSITRWEHITKQATTKKFMILFAGEQAVVCLPLSALTAEAKETILQRTPRI